MPRFTGRFVMNPAKVVLMYFPVICSKDKLKKIITLILKSVFSESNLWEVRIGVSDLLI